MPLPSSESLSCVSVNSRLFRRIKNGDGNGSLTVGVRSTIGSTQSTQLSKVGSKSAAVGVSFGKELTTLDNLSPAEKRANRMVEYQYRFIKIIDTSDPIFEGIANTEKLVRGDYRTGRRYMATLRVQF